MRAKLFSTGLTGTVVSADPFQFKVRFDKPQAGALFAFWPREHCFITDTSLPVARGALPQGPRNVPRKECDPSARRARRNAHITRMSERRPWQYIPHPTKQGVA